MSLFLALPARAEVFELFVIAPVSEVGQGVTIYDINGGDREIAAINRKLARDGVTSEDAGAHYVTDTLRRALSNQATGLMRAAGYQLRYFPALVIDRRYVVYGTTSTRDYYRMKPDHPHGPIGPDGPND